MLLAGAIVLAAGEAEAQWQYVDSLDQARDLVGVALVAGCVDAISGSGGLLTLPTLLTAGLSGPMALGIEHTPHALADSPQPRFVTSGTAIVHAGDAAGGHTTAPASRGARGHRRRGCASTRPMARRQ